MSCTTDKVPENSQAFFAWGLTIVNVERKVHLYALNSLSKSP
jgi:hypothetical protein